MRNLLICHNRKWRSEVHPTHCILSIREVDRYNDRNEWRAAFNLHEWEPKNENTDRMEKISHNFIETMSNGKNISDIKQATQIMIRDLSEILEISNIHLDLTSKLELDTDSPPCDLPRVPMSSNSILHSAILNMKTFSHIKEKSYTIEQLEELAWILEKFRNNHMTIRRALKISNSSFYKIKKEIEALNNTIFKSKRKSQNLSNHSVLEKEYISILIKPQLLLNP